MLVGVRQQTSSSLITDLILLFVFNRYGIGVFAPGDFTAPGKMPYIAAHNLIKAHARAFRMYDAKYRATQGGMLGMTMSTEWAEPSDPTNPDDVAAADRFVQVKFRYFMNDFTNYHRFCSLDCYLE